MDAKANIEIKNSKGETPFFEVINHSNEEWTDDIKSMLKLMLEYKADINTTNIKGHTPLMYSIILKNSQKIKTLLEYKADIHAESKSGNVALDYAVCEGSSVEIIKLLKTSRAQIPIEKQLLWDHLKPY